MIQRSLLSTSLHRCCRQQRHQQLIVSSKFSSSASDEPPEDSATIIQGPSLLTMTGVHRPSPSLFQLPGLRSLPFWTAPESASAENRKHRVAFNDPLVTTAVEYVESNYESIRSEYFASVLGQGRETDLDSGKVLKPLEPDYDVSTKGGEHADDALHSGNWDWHSYVLNGRKNEKFKERCPKTAEVIDTLEKEGLLFGTPFGFCFFSTLHGNSSIQAHSGPMNLRLRMHLPLVVPPKKDNAQSSSRPTTGIRVADQVREWHEGKAVILDDSYVHEVWNDANSPRVLLLLDLWHPDVQMEERQKISTMFSYAKEKGWIGQAKKQ
mmetsp:Transcript_23946/g.36628  ORF Transcript_23946/g.36628 Transcript_23946/m.36628 type:complete len:323 (+) Transcript_23946:104-1072(+)